VGDDETDEDVFSLSDTRILTVRIGEKKFSAARFFLKRQTEIAEVLRYIVETGDRNTRVQGGNSGSGVMQAEAGAG